MTRNDPSFSPVPLSTPVLCATLFAAASLVLGPVALQPWAPVEHLVRDPLLVAEQAAECCGPYIGMVSNLGVVLWIAAATASLFTALLIARVGASAGSALFFAASGLLSLGLGLDDLFLVHEEVLPTFGVPQPVTLAFYAAAGLAYALFGLRRILAGRVALFVIAGCGLGGSLALDAFVHIDTSFWIFLEDGLKFLGLVFWAGFQIVTALEAAVALATGQLTAISVSAARVGRMPGASPAS